MTSIFFAIFSESLLNLMYYQITGLAMNILLLNPIYVTFFWALVLILSAKSSKEPKFFLGWFMFIASWVYISHYFYFTEQFDVYLYLDSFYTLAYLLVYPLYHIYVRLLTVDSRFSLRRHYQFLVAPFAVFALTLIGYLVMGRERGISFISDILVAGQRPSSRLQEAMYILFVVGRLTFLFQIFFYLVLNFRLIRKNNLRIKDYYSNTDDRRLTWLQFFNFCLALTSLSSVALAVIGRNLFLHNLLLLLFPSAIFSILLFTIGLLGSKQQAVFVEIDNTSDIKGEGKLPQRMKNQLEKLFDMEKVYKNPDLKVWDIGSMLGISHLMISKFIKKEYGKNFCDFVNDYRVEHAKSLVTSNPNLTNDQVAVLAGFTSATALNRALQWAEGATLGQYLKRNNV